LTRQLVEKIRVGEGKIVIEFKSGVAVEVQIIPLTLVADFKVTDVGYFRKYFRNYFIKSIVT